LECPGVTSAEVIAFLEVVVVLMVLEVLNLPKVVVLEMLPDPEVVVPEVVVPEVVVPEVVVPEVVVPEVVVPEVVVPEGKVKVFVVRAACSCRNAFRGFGATKIDDNEVNGREEEWEEELVDKLVEEKVAEEELVEEKVAKEELVAGMLELEKEFGETKEFGMKVKKSPAG
jgi:hypothetical protein